MKPILQALLLADKIYQDVTGKKVIAGTFDRLFFKRRIVEEEVEIDGKKKKLVVGGMQAGSPSAYISLTDVRGKVKCCLRYVELEGDQALMQTEFLIESDDPLKSLELIIPLPVLPIVKAGAHALELLCNGEAVGSHRIHVEEMPDDDPTT